MVSTSIEGVSKENEETFKYLYGNIVFAGRTTKIKKFDQRLQFELEEIVDEKPSKLD